MNLKVSLICTVLNEGHSIKKLLACIQQQTHLPDEIIFVDGGCVDETVSILKRYAITGGLPIRVITAAGANISQGRNLAIKAAIHPVIASTDKSKILLGEQFDIVIGARFTNESDLSFFNVDSLSHFEMVQKSR